MKIINCNQSLMDAFFNLPLKSQNYTFENISS